METEEGLRTVECLRGRLLAERATSRAAKEDAEKMGNKLIEIENQLREEIKSRDIAEKKMKLLLKKLKSMNITYLSDDLEHSNLMDKIEISSVSSNSTAPSSTIDAADEEHNSPKIISDKFGTQKQININNSPHASDNLIAEMKIESIEKEKTQTASNSSEQSVLQTDTSCEIKCSQNYTDLERDDYSLKSSVEDKEIDGGNDKDQQDDYVDNSLALVPVDLPKKAQNIDPIVLDATVRDVLAALRHAKEKLKSSMERRPMIRVGSR